MPRQGFSGLNVVVSGGAGFIGSEVTRQLCEAGASVTVLDNLLNGRRENLSGLPPDRCRLVVEDVRNAHRLPELFHGVDTVFHLACLCLRHSLHAPFDNHDVNATGTLRMLAAAMDADVGRFVYTSTAEVYGTPLGAPVAEDHPNRPTHVYGASKLAGEAYTRGFHRTYGFPTVVVRLFNTYGPRSHHQGDCGEVIPRFLLRALAGKPLVVFGDGSQTRDFTFVEDTAAAILQAALVDQAIGDTFNIGTGIKTSITELAHQVAEVAGLESPEVLYEAERPADVLGTFYGDVSKAERVLEFKATVELSDGLERLRNWYQSLEDPPEALLEQEVLHNWVATELTSNA